MTQVDLQQFGVMQTNLGRPPPEPYIPRQFNPLTRGRFLKARRLRHLARVHGQPTDAQIEMARSAAVLEWGALQAEHDGSLTALREAREHRRLLLRVLPDFERSIAKSEPSEHEPRLADIVADIAAKGASE